MMKRRVCQQSRRVQRRKRRVAVRDDDRDSGAAKDDRVAATQLHTSDQILKILNRLVILDSVDELIHYDGMVRTGIT